MVADVIDHRHMNKVNTTFKVLAVVRDTSTSFYRDAL